MNLTRMSFAEKSYAKLVLSVGVIILRIAILVLVVISMNEALETILGVIDDIRHKQEIIFYGALMAVLVPSGCVFFWGCRAVWMQLAKPSLLLSRDSRIIEPENRRCAGAQSTRSPHPARRIIGTGYPMEPESPSGRKASLLQWVERGWRVAREPGAGLWMGAGSCGALVLTIVAVALFGIGSTAVHQALRLTGRWSLLLFWPAYAGGAMVALFGPRWNILARHGREFGLAYAAAQLVHFALVALWLRIRTSRSCSR